MKRKNLIAISVIATLSLGLFSWGAVAGAGEVMGLVTRAGQASIVVDDQPDGDRVVTIRKVVAPVDSFVVIHQNQGGMPGERLGVARVEKGVTRDLRIELDPGVPLTPELLAAVHVDRGTKGTFEFDMENLERSTDKPFFVDGKEVARSFKAAAFGVPVKMGEAAIEVSDQPAGETLTVSKVTAPAKAFVVVHKEKPDGMPGERVGYASIDAGTTNGVQVSLDKKLDGTTPLIAAVHVDADEDGSLDFEMSAPVESPDQPFFADGMEVAARFKAGPFGIKSSDAAIEASDQLGATGSITIDRADAPQDSWIVVHKAVNGAPGERVGLVRVEAGVSKDVEVQLSTDVLPEQLIVALHADRGEAESFDFDMMDKLGSSDQPYFVDGEEVARVINVRSFGYPGAAGTASIAVPDQTVSNGVLRVASASAPEGAWIVVHLDAGGAPGARVGLMHIPAGTTTEALVQLDASKRLTDTVFVAVHADRGEAGDFEFDMMDRANSADQPFFVDGKEVAVAATVR